MRKVEDDLVLEICLDLNLLSADIKGRRRKKHICERRHCISYILFFGYKFSLQQIGDYLGGRHHSTIINSIKAVRNSKSLYDLCESHNSIKNMDAYEYHEYLKKPMGNIIAIY